MSNCAPLGWSQTGPDGLEPPPPDDEQDPDQQDGGDTDQEPVGAHRLEPVRLVALASNGGPYEDEAFLAGFVAGNADATLSGAAELNATSVTVPAVPPLLLQQIRVLAWRHGYPAICVKRSPESASLYHVTVCERMPQ